jgi:hypothetical protein
MFWSEETIIRLPLQELQNKVQYSANNACYMGSHITYKGNNTYVSTNVLKIYSLDINI